MTSQFESYLASIHDLNNKILHQQNINKIEIDKRQKGAGKETACNTKLCKHITKDVSHIISSCPAVSVRNYLLIKHNVVPKTVLRVLILKTDPTEKFKYRQDLNTSIKSEVVNFAGIFSFKLRQS